MTPKYPVLAGAIAQRGIVKARIAQAMGISYRAFHNKMTGKSPLTWEELCVIQSQFFPDMSKDELFRVN